MRGPASLIALLALGCASCAPVDDRPTSGGFSLLTYNVAGLPEGLNDDQNPVVNTPLISPLLNAFDLVLVQEDFTYTFELRSALEFEFESFPKEDLERFLGDGLNRFSRFSFDPEVERRMWEACNGFTDNSNDCLAEKGVSFARVSVAEGIEIDVYNLHMDAGGGEEDGAARDAQIDQLLAFVEERSADRPVIIAGDTNLSHEIGAGDPDEPRLARLLEQGGLVDGCQDRGCPDLDRIDRVFIRQGGELNLSFDSWAVAEEFVDGEGGPLSDHEAVAVELSWTREP